MIDSWTQLPAKIQQTIETTWANGMPPIATALYGRWWQFETWLRSLVYVELRTALGSAWAQALPLSSESRQRGEGALQYMVTPDAQNRLAYADVSALFQLIGDRWHLFERALIPKNVWAGRVEELRAIRNRIGHCRRPHADDLARLEQTLRDLEHGTFTALSAFNRQWRVPENFMDSLVEQWVRGRHIDAVRVVEHAERQYDISFQLRYSYRPWVDGSVPIEKIAGASGYVWHAFWYFRGSRELDIEMFWRDLGPYRDAVLMVCADTSMLNVSFSALESEAFIADAIGRCFDSAISNLRRARSADEQIESQACHSDFDTRVQLKSLWSSVDDSMRGFSLFGA